MTDTFCLELWHGPTCAFKDMALQMLPHLLTASLVKTEEEKTVCILVATSGDTGQGGAGGLPGRGPHPASWCSTPRTVSPPSRSFRWSPRRGTMWASARCSATLTMPRPESRSSSPTRRSARSWPSRGYFLSSANSINWGRVLPQIVYYISAYCDLLRDEKIQPDAGGERLRPHRQLRQHSGRLLRQGDGGARSTG